MLCLAIWVAQIVVPVTVLVLAWSLRDRETFDGRIRAELREWRSMIRKLVTRPAGQNIRERPRVAGEGRLGPC